MPTLTLEQRAQQQGFFCIAGVDEVGRGPLAGPIVAAAVILPSGLSGAEPWLSAINDSKQLSSSQREEAVALVHQHATAIGVGQVDHTEIDRVGIDQANVWAMLQAISRLSIAPDYLFFDFVRLKEVPPPPLLPPGYAKTRYVTGATSPLQLGNGRTCPFELIVKGDSLSYSIAAASIVAKVTRDRLMDQADPLYPQYSFAHNKGYSSAEHLAKLRALGPCALHRLSFAPVQAALASPQAISANVIFPIARAAE